MYSKGSAGYSSVHTVADFAGERCADEVGAGGDFELVQKAAAVGKECPCEYPEYPVWGISSTPREFLFEGRLQRGKASHFGKTHYYWSTSRSRIIKRSGMQRNGGCISFSRPMRNGRARNIIYSI